MTDPEINKEEDASMHHREITLADGRYMIFYTFEDDGRCSDTDRDEQGEDV
jgi:hypothetical protein